MAETRWLIRVDTGGTFTDCVAVDPAGRVRRAKILSSAALRGRLAAQLGPAAWRVEQSWGAPDDVARGMTLRRLGDEEDHRATVTRFDAGRSLLELDQPIPGVAPGDAFELRSREEAPVLAARLVTGTAGERPLPPLSMRLATTRGTNALLERTGAPLALFITRGFGDLPMIGDQQRPDLFALAPRLPAPLVERVVEVDERVGADGRVLRPLDEEGLAAEARRLHAEGARSAAVAFMHAYRAPDHEERAAAILRGCGFTYVCTSSELAPLIGFLPRTETAIVDATLGPVVADYLARVRSAVDGVLHVMTSAGGLVRADRFRAKDALLSGPAGGVAGAVAAGRRSGAPKVIAFDMGGTSTDVSRAEDGRHEYHFEHRAGRARLLAPALAIETVAAGGGSVCGFEHERLFVGPRSAGAAPGPACYGTGGPLTLTDVNLLLGRLAPERLGIPIVTERAEAALAEVIASMERAGRDVPDVDALLAGFLELADDRMADAIARVSTRRGYDPADYALVAFGGAGPQHACAIADRLGMRAAIVPADAGLLSAIGLDEAVVERFAQRQVLEPLDAVVDRLDGWLDALGDEAAREVIAEGAERGAVEPRDRLVDLRIRGQDATISLRNVDIGRLEDVFRRRYRDLYGHEPEGAIEVVALRATAAAPSAASCETTAPDPGGGEPAPLAIRSMYVAGCRRPAPVFERGDLAAGAQLTGPALLVEAHATTVIEPGWSARVDGAGALVLTRGEGAAADPPPEVRGSRPEIVELELFANRLQAIAEEMGQMLERTARSTNVKQRLDFSCTVLDAYGRLVVNAPHMPVHLGAMGVCVRAVLDRMTLDEDDVVVTNHPGFGGSHLPDLTVIAPVHAAGGQRIAFVATRAHHAEIGGTRPGSMPPDARSLVEEGVVIEPFKLARRGAAEWEAMRRRLAEAIHPSRAVEDNLADLRAQLAANRHGATALRSLASARDPDLFGRLCAGVTARAGRAMRAALAAWPDGRYEAQERLDDGTPLRVAIDVRGDRARLDFTGSGEQHRGNLNATPAIVRSVVIYVLRLMVGERLPLNEGLMERVELIVPPGLLAPHFPDDPAACPAVVGGNVETSQRLVDTLLRALGLAACSQGTMNNTLFGTDELGYYETVCGGAGATAERDGASALHTHMTNTRITDPEILEHRYPVRLERFAVRRGSGGRGRRTGGDGAVREIVFLEPMRLSVLGQHRVEAPYGMEGGEPGARGSQRVIRASGEVVTLTSVDGCDVGEGDRLITETPGGGGWGRKVTKSAESAKS